MITKDYPPVHCYKGKRTFQQTNRSIVLFRTQQEQRLISTKKFDTKGDQLTVAEIINMNSGKEHSH